MVGVIAGTVAGVQTLGKPSGSKAPAGGGEWVENPDWDFKAANAAGESWDKRPNDDNGDSTSTGEVWSIGDRTCIVLIPFACAVASRWIRTVRA